nr:hypothetical protein [Sporomusa acidovorans]
MTLLGTDFCLTVTGGDRSHLGAVAVAQVGESMIEAGKLTTTVSTITLLGHKEDGMARDLAARLATAVAANVVVCCGIHLDNITPDEIKTVRLMSNEMAGEIIQYVQDLRRA